jgi:SAM-dependent methyltransferase
MANMEPIKEGKRLRGCDDERSWPPECFAREDENDDAIFYSTPRKVVHLDDGAIAALGRLYAELLPQGGLLLDLMSSWRTHLPDGFEAGRVIGLGMNAEEMADNPQLFKFQVQDLNRKRRFPYGKNPNFEGAMCAVSIQYLTHPICVFREVHRVLYPDAPFIVTFTNRCFPPKTIALWLATDDRQHLDLVTAYFRLSGGWTEPVAENRLLGTGGRDPLYAVWARKAQPER